MTNLDFKQFTTGKTIFYCKKQLSSWHFGSFTLDHVKLVSEKFDFILFDMQKNDYKISGDSLDTVIFENQEDLNTFIEKLISGKEDFKPFEISFRSI